MPRPLQLNETAPFAVRNGAQRIGERLTLARKRRRLTVRELASKAGISYDTARAVEAGDRKSTRLNSSHPRLSRMPSSA